MKTKTLPLSSFCRAYLITALWSSTDEEGNPLDARFSIADLSTEALASAAADCAAFEADNLEIIQAAIATGKVKCGPDFDEMERAGKMPLHNSQIDHEKPPCLQDPYNLRGRKPDLHARQ